MEEEKGGGASRMQCRLWWPKHILVAEGSPQTMLLLGWVIPGFRNSIDIVVATSVPLEEADSLPANTHLQTVTYEQPRYGSHHFSYMSWSSLYKASNICNGAKPSMMPNWMVEIEQQLEPSNLDVVVLAMNSATAMQNIAQELLNSPCASCKQLSLISIMMVILRKMTAASMALIAVVFYVSLQLISKILSKRAFSILNTNLLKLFRHASINLNIRSRQLMHWPVILLESGCRGRKRNPLRARIDSFDYSVEQHVVGSLVFTPLLLLVPTTSVFYVFFTILNMVASLTCIGFQFLISGFHAFPYAEIAIWLMNPKRFPSGVWFKQIWTGSSQLSDAMSRYPAVKEIGRESNLRDTDEIVKKSAFQLSNAEMLNGQCSFGFLPCNSEIVVSSLGINSASLGEIIRPHINKTFKGLSLSSGVSCVYKVFSGGRVPSSVDIGMPALMPWTSISFKEFWWITYEAVLACL